MNQPRPVPLTSFVGRDRELADLETLIGSARLITLTGPGGSGKTRLAREFAARRAPSAPVVDLASITEAGAILTAVAAAMGIHEEPGTDLGETIAAAVADRDTLVVLDNLEQIPDAGLVIAALVASAPGLRVLATSRASLHVRAEHEFPVAPLEEAPALALFLDRARAIDPQFTPGEEGTAAIAGICTRLDGLPLAIELAAARTRLFTPVALLERLNQRLPTLSEGPADAPDRQRTLHATIAWSYDLLAGDEQRAFAALGVFAGGFTLSAAEAIAIGPEGTPGVLADLERLVDQNVLTVSPDADGDPRFRMLETIREFAWGQVPDADRIALRDRHLAYFVERAERAEPLMRGAEQATWVRRLAAEQTSAPRSRGRRRPTRTSRCSGSPPRCGDASGTKPADSAKGSAGWKRGSRPETRRPPRFGPRRCSARPGSCGRWTTGTAPRSCSRRASPSRTPTITSVGSRR